MWYINIYHIPYTTYNICLLDILTYLGGKEVTGGASVAAVVVSGCSRHGVEEPPLFLPLPLPRSKRPSAEVASHAMTMIDAIFMMILI